MDDPIIYPAKCSNSSLFRFNGAARFFFIVAGYFSGLFLVHGDLLGECDVFVFHHFFEMAF